MYCAVTAVVVKTVARLLQLLLCSAAARLQTFTCRQTDAPPHCVLRMRICVTARVASIKSINASRVRRHADGVVYACI
ncbi:hypothetical protein HDV63DRAFT_369823 [Trichoderma sp. SZMC 28014]